MTLFLNLSFGCRASLGLWTLLLCLAGIVAIVMSVAVRRYGTTLFSLPLFAVSYFMWQATACFLYLSESEITSALCIWIGRLPLTVWIMVLLLLSAGSALVLYLLIRYSRTFITPLSIEYCADELTCGICYYRENGHVVFSNACINTLSLQLTGRPLMDGKRLRNAITDTIIPVGERMWQFSFRDMVYGKEKLCELIATDVTELYAESRTLKAGNERLAGINEELRVYGLKIDETVRRQEMLQAKVSIHDEMNKLMLSTIAADIENEEELNRVFTLWERNALLLCMETHRNEDTGNQLLELANALGIHLLWDNGLPESLSSKQRELFFAAAQEAITNAVKHAQAKMMKIFFVETQKDIQCIFENDSDIPVGDIHFTGGLANLSVLANEQEATVSAKADRTFKLTLIFPKIS